MGVGIRLGTPTLMPVSGGGRYVGYRYNVFDVLKRAGRRIGCLGANLKKSLQKALFCRNPLSTQLLRIIQSDSF